MFGLFSSLGLAGPSRVFARGFSSTPVAQKLKSHSGAKKRFFLTGSGKGQAGKRHLNTLFSAGHINRLAKTAYTSVSQTKRVRKLLPYAK